MCFPLYCGVGREPLAAVGNGGRAGRTQALRRRDFLKTSAAATLAYGAMPAVFAQDRGKRFKTAIIGAGWWGMNILHEAMASGRCQVTAICDVDQKALQSAARDVEQKSGEKPRQYTDF